MRNDFFDFSKGILILLVILGHAIQYCAVNENVWLNPIFNIIYTFHMPLFVFLSGYFFYTCLKKSFKDVLTSRFKRLIVPEIMNSLIIIILFSLISKFQYESFHQIYNLTDHRILPQLPAEYRGVGIDNLFLPDILFL